MMSSSSVDDMWIHPSIVQAISNAFAPVISSFLKEMEQIFSGTKSMDHLQSGCESTLPSTVSLQIIRGTDTGIDSLENYRTKSCTSLDSVESLQCNNSTGTALKSVENLQCTDCTRLDLAEYSQSTRQTSQKVTLDRHYVIGTQAYSWDYYYGVKNCVAAEFPSDIYFLVRWKPLVKMRISEQNVMWLIMTLINMISF